MEHLNYCRQIVKQARSLLEIPRIRDGQAGHLWRHIVDLTAMSQKFLLPSGGRILGDFEFRALEPTEPLRLPHPFIALEFEPARTPVGADQQRSSKRVVFAREDQGVIRVKPIIYWDARGTWAPYMDVGIPQDGWKDYRAADGRTAFHVLKSSDAQDDAMADYQDELSALMDFLNALACSNVHAERSEPKKAGKKIKAALPFDTYHYLTIDVPGAQSGVGTATGGHRSPREHLRRGHIRRLQDGRRIWVNAAVINAGVGGKVTKDYRLRVPEPA